MPPTLVTRCHHSRGPQNCPSCSSEGPEAAALMGPVVGWKTDSGAAWATWRERREEASKLEFPSPPL